MKKLYGIRILGSLVLVLILCAVFFVYPAKAMNLDYLAPQKWADNDKITLERITLSDMENTYDGELAYYADNENLCFYTRFTVNGELRDVKITYYVETPSESYAFAVDESGICEDDNNEEPRIFDAAADYSYSYDGMYFSAIQYKGKETCLSLSVVFYANGRVCYRKDGLCLEVPTTTKPEKTTKEAVSAKDKTTTKSSGNTQAPAKTTSAPAPTKYHPTGYSGSENTTEISSKKHKRANNKSSDEIITDGISVYNVGVEDGAPQNETEMSASSKTMLAVACAAALGGLGVLIYAALKKEKPAPEKADNPEPDENKN